MGLWPITGFPVAEPSLPDGEAPPRHILVVNEVEGAVSEITASLTGAGYKVDVVATPGQALEHIRESEVEVILLGESLPGMSGLDLLRLLRAAWTPQQLPVIMLARETEQGLEAEALAAGANDCMAHCVEGGRALARVRSQLQQKDVGQGARDRAERVFRAMSVSTDVIWEWNISTNAFWFSSEWGLLAGKPAAGPAQLTDWLEMVHPDDVGILKDSLERLHRDSEQWEFGQEYRLVTPAGEIRWIYCRATVERDRDGSLLRLTGLQTDITRNKSIDWLTQLPNRETILGRVDRMLVPPDGGHRQPFAVLLMDLDRFRVINESLGPTAGDRILREVAMRLERATRTMPSGGRPEDILARVHGDTFLMILSDVRSPDLARSIADRLQAQIRRPLQLAGREIRVSASIGIAMSEAESYTQSFDMLRDAEIALHQAKAMGRARAVNFDAEMRTDAVHRMDLEIDLRHVLENEQLVLHYQPKIDLRTGDLAGFEALLRWRHPQLGLIPPLKFIPIAEETGMIIPVGSWAIEESAHQFAQWRRMLPESTDLQVSVNLSVKQFFDRDLVDLVSRVVRDLRLPPGSFCMEVTESVLIGDVETAAKILNRLQAAGAGLMIDDFGTGYSSLNYLTNLPFDALKIDRSFVSRLEEDESSAEVVKAVVALARTLKLDVIAEGVETPEQLYWLQQIECRYAQGYYFATPVDAETATRMVRASRPI